MAQDASQRWNRTDGVLIAPGTTPEAVADAFAADGAEWIHVVDLDGAFAGESRNGDAVRSIVACFPGHVQLGGGIRTAQSVERWFDLGVARVVIGTAALENPQTRMMNMLALYVLARSLSVAMSGAAMVALYFVAQVAAGLVQLWLSDSPLPVVGASGAIFGLLGTADEILISGRVGDVGERIAAERAAARERVGWIMDIYLLRKQR